MNGYVAIVERDEERRAHISEMESCLSYAASLAYDGRGENRQNLR